MRCDAVLPIALDRAGGTMRRHRVRLRRTWVRNVDGGALGHARGATRLACYRNGVTNLTMQRNWVRGVTGRPLAQAQDSGEGGDGVKDGWGYDSEHEHIQNTW